MKTNMQRSWGQNKRIKNNQILEASFILTLPYGLPDYLFYKFDMVLPL